MQPGVTAQSMALPRLREELQLLRRGTGKHGEPIWLIFDPARHRYFKIGRQAYELLRHWHAQTSDALLSIVNADNRMRADGSDVERLVRFLFANNLTVTSASGQAQDFVEQSRAVQRSWLVWLIHNYLFIRIPLVRPSRFLARSYPFVAPLFSRVTAFIVLAMSLGGLYLVSRQWEAFTSTFLHFFSLQGLLYYGLALVLVKIVHEFGHAYTATRYGCRVPTMGVAFLVLFPVLYTDTTDAWRLHRRRQRLFIGAAGIIVELAIAGVATFLWSFMPDGGARSAVFILATLTWITSLLVNLNPFMRFDGYYLLADMLGVENLQARGFAMGKWRLREILFGLREAPPERYSPAMARTLVLYSWGTWIYRFFLFLGIAFLIYTFFIKVVAVVLFVIEILWFILLPIWRELQHWWRIRERIMQTTRTKITFAVVLLLTCLVFVPWRSSVKVPAIVQVAEKMTVYPPAAARVDTIFIERGQTVNAGDPLFQLHSDQVNQRIRESELTLKLIALQISRSPADAVDRANLQVLRDQYVAEQENLQGLTRLRDELLVRAPIDGVVRELDRGLHAGVWVAPDNALAMLVQPGAHEVVGVVGEEDLWRLSETATGRFFPDDATQAPFNVRVEKITPAGERTLKHPYLASIYGGPVAVEPDIKTPDALRTSDAVFGVAMVASDGDLPGDRVRRGLVHLRGRREAPAWRIWRRVVRVLIRESGF